MALEGSLLYLTYIATILLSGILTTLIANKLKIPNMLFLIVVGIVFGTIPFQGSPLMSFPPLFVTSIAVLALVMIVFDSASRFKLREIKAYSFPALNLSIIFLVLNLLILSLFSIFIFPELSSLWVALVFAGIMSGTDPAVVLTMFKNSKSRVIEVLEIESIINTPIVVLIPFIILDLQKSFGQEFIISSFIGQLAPFLQQIVSGIGAGILVGIVIFKFMRNAYSETLSPLAIITAALLTYILAENLGGNGVLAVTVMGLFFGNLYVKEKAHLTEFSSMFANFLEILVFVMVGLIIKIPLTSRFITKSLLLFGVYLLLRYLSVQYTFRKLDYSFREKLFMSLNVQKGIAAAVVVLTLSTLGLPSLRPVLDLSLIFMIYSLVLATFLIKIVKYILPSVTNQKTVKVETAVEQATDKIEDAMQKLEEVKQVEKENKAIRSRSKKAKKGKKK